MQAFRIGSAAALILIQVFFHFELGLADSWTKKGEVAIDPDTRRPLQDGTTRKIIPERAQRPVTGTKLRPYRDVHVTLYMTSWCPYCRKARELLNSLGVNVTEHDIERDKAMAAEKRRVSGGYSGVPLLDIEGILIRGFSPDAIKNAIERRRSGQ